MTGTDLSHLDPLGRFTGRAGLYALNRPSYPPGAIDAILRGAEVPIHAAADVGAGTGISARLLAEQGLRVIAIEPNAAMRGAAEPHPGVQWMDSAAERTGLGDRSVELVLCAQAFHWFRAEEALAEFARILASGGRLALMWNEGDAASPVTAVYYEQLRRVATDATVQKAHEPPPAFWSSPLFSRQREHRFVWAHELTLDGFIGRALSASYAPREGPRAEALAASLRQVHAAHADARGLVSMAYTTRLFLAERAPR